MPGGRRSPIDRAARELAQVRRHVGLDRRLSLDEAIHIARGISRRDFLRFGGTAAAGLLLAGCEGKPSAEPLPPPADHDGPCVVIVGAGLAGMTAAYRLQQAGVACSVFESRDRVGGRCWSAREFAGGQVAEHGGEFVDTRHVHLRLLAEELGLELDDLWASWVPGSTWLNFVNGQLVKPGELFDEIDAAVTSVMRLARSSSYFASEASPEMRAFDEMTEAEWYEANVGLLGSPAYRLWAARQAGWYGLDPERLGAASLIDFYAIDYPGGDERYTIQGGNDQVPGRILDELPEGTVTLEASLVGLLARDDGTVELRFDGVAAPVVADRVILTVPFPALGEVDLDDAGFSPELRRAIDELGMGTNAKVLLQFDRPFFTGFGNWSGGMQRGDDPAFGTWESGSTDGGKLGLLTVYSGGEVGAGYPGVEPHELASSSVVEDTLAAIDEVVPGVSGSFTGVAWLDLWIRDPWVRGSYAAFLPGQITGFFGTLAEPQGTVHIAGEHTSVFSQGYLNGGVESGSRAAAEVLEALGKPLPPGLVRTFEAAERYRPVYPWASAG